MTTHSTTKIDYGQDRSEFALAQQGPLGFDQRSQN